MKIGLLIPGHPPDEMRAEIGSYADLYEALFAGQGFTFARWHVVEGVFPAGPEEADAWLIGGSRHGVYEDHPWIAPLEDLARAIVAAGKPLAGICFGHQLIAQALGGKVGKYAGGWSIGRTIYDIDGTDMALNAWHQDQVLTPPDGARTIGATDFCAHAALQIGDKVFTLQPHPEYDAHVIEGLIDHRAKAAGVPHDISGAARAALPLPTDEAVMADRIATFFRNGAL